MFVLNAPSVNCCQKRLIKSRTLYSPPVLSVSQKALFKKSGERPRPDGALFNYIVDEFCRFISNNNIEWIAAPGTANAWHAWQFNSYSHGTISSWQVCSCARSAYYGRSVNTPRGACPRAAGCLFAYFYPCSKWHVRLQIGKRIKTQSAGLSSCETATHFFS